MITAPTNAEKKNRKLIEKYKREQLRRSNDRIKVFNPTKEEMVVIFDGFRHPFKPQSETTTPRYIWDRYKVKMTDHQITKENEKRVDKENKHRIESGQKIMDAQERELFDLRTNDSELIKKYMIPLYRGIHEEFGIDEPIKEVVEQADKRPLHESVSESIEDAFEPLSVPAKKEKTKSDNIKQKKGELKQELSA